MYLKYSNGKTILPAVEGQRPRNYLSCYFCCCWIFHLIYALSTSTTVLPLFFIRFWAATWLRIEEPSHLTTSPTTLQALTVLSATARRQLVAPASPPALPPLTAITLLWPMEHHTHILTVKTVKQSSWVVAMPRLALHQRIATEKCILQVLTVTAVTSMELAATRFVAFFSLRLSF